MWQVQWSDGDWFFSDGADFLRWTSANTEHPKSFGARRPVLVTGPDSVWFTELIRFDEILRSNIYTDALFAWKPIPQNLRLEGSYRYIRLDGVSFLVVIHDKDDFYQADLFTLEGWVKDVFRATKRGDLKWISDQRYRNKLVRN